MKTYLELMDSFKNYVKLHEEGGQQAMHDGTVAVNKTPAQIFSETINGLDKSSTFVHQFVIQTEEILTNKRHSFKIELKSTDNFDSIQSMFSTFKDAFERFLNDCKLNRAT